MQESHTWTSGNFTLPILDILVADDIDPLANFVSPPSSIKPSEIAAHLIKMLDDLAKRVNLDAMDVDNYEAE